MHYKSLRMELHSNFIRDQANCAKTDPRLFWHFVNSKRKANALETATSDKRKADLFAEFFKFVYVQHNDDIHLLEFINHRHDAKCFTTHCTTDIVHTVLVKMDLNKGSRFDGISSLFLRKCADHIAKPLSDIFSR